MEEINVIIRFWDVFRIKDIGKSMTICSCFEMTMPLFPTIVVLEFGVIRGTSFDTALKGSSIVGMDRS
jgi:hypothetical protein